MKPTLSQAISKMVPQRGPQNIALPVAKETAFDVRVITGQGICNGPAKQVVNAHSRRQAFKLTNLSAVDIFIGSDPSVNPSSGDLLLGVRGAWIGLPTIAAIWICTAGSPAAYSYLEIFE